MAVRLAIEAEPVWLAWVSWTAGGPDERRFRLVAQLSTDGRWRRLRTYASKEEAELGLARVERQVASFDAEPGFDDLRRIARRPGVPGRG